MKYRIAMWATTGFLVAFFWVLYDYATSPPAMTSADPIATLSVNLPSYVSSA